MLWETKQGASMADRSKVDQVASGVPYVVTMVNGRPPESLDDFVADAVVAMTVAAADQVVTIHGSARRDADAVVVFEKDSDGIGKDVRTWQVRREGGRFEAVERSTY